MIRTRVPGTARPSRRAGMCDAGPLVCFGSMRSDTDDSLRSLSVAPFIVLSDRVHANCKSVMTRAREKNRDSGVAADGDAAAR